MIIYKLINNVNKKIYIGQTSFNIEKRFNEHIKGAKRKRPRLYIHRAMKKYGIDNFSYSIIFECDNKKELDERELEFINEYNSLTPFGYNMILNASGGDLFSNHPNKDDVRKRISEGTKAGIKKSKKSWSESHKGSKNGMYGRKHTPNSIKKMSLNRRGKCCGLNNPMSKQKEDSD